MDKNALDTSENELLELARGAARHAYAPYSDFPVGAAVRTDAGVFFGCNVENASFGLTVCAERVAVWTAISHGATRVFAMAVSCVKTDAASGPGANMPCGACRQVLSEFMRPESTVIIDGVGKWAVAELMPFPFQLRKNAAPEE